MRAGPLEDEYEKHNCEYRTSNDECRMSRCTTVTIDFCGSTFIVRYSIFAVQDWHKPMIKNQDVVVVLEICDERARAINSGLLAEGSRIAGLLGGNLTAIIEEPGRHSNQAWVQAAKARLEAEAFRALLFAHTDKGSERAPLLAQALDASAVTDCFDVRCRDGNLYYARYVYGGQFEQEVSFANPPEIVSLNVESLEARAGCPGVAVPLKNISLPIPEIEDGKKTIKKIPPDFKTIDIRYAQRILDIGAGCDRPELLTRAEELGSLLEACVGTTRLVVDSGSIPKSRMIGQTGKAASPELCLALGVSGSPHHMAGLQKAAKILAVNSEERAPIFGVSDAGFVIDLKALLPKLVSRIKQYRDKDRT
jgi:electron transfer flavoprotein alpha subunit